MFHVKQSECKKYKFNKLHKMGNPMEYIKSKIRDVQDFPSKGILFKDLTTAFKDPRALHIIGWDLSLLYRDKGVT